MSLNRFKPPQAAPSPLALPPEVVVHILAAVPLAERLSSVAPVCKQLRALCSAPALLSDLDVSISSERAVPRTESLLRLLVRHAQHVRRLRLDIQVQQGSADDFEVAALVAACLGACAARQEPPSGGLRELNITPYTPLLNTSWVPLLRALRQLWLPFRPKGLRVRLDSSWRQLTALQLARISGHILCDAGEGPCLPSSLVWLCIDNDKECDQDGEDDAQLRQLDARVLAGLPVLETLWLSHCACERSSLAAVSGLTALTRLALHTVAALPPAHALAALAPSLRALELHSAVSDEGSDTLESALSALTALELLALDFEVVEGAAPHMPLAMASMPQLHHVALSLYDDEPGACQGLWHGPAPQLPLASLRWLGVPLEAAFQLQFSLADAQQLETLCLLLPGASGQLDAWLATDAWPALWQLIATHPPLRCLLYEVPADSPPFSYQLLDALLLLKDQRPSLEVRRLAAPKDRVEEPPACWKEMHLDLLF